MKILVTGGAGFIGSHLMRKLQNVGYEAVALDNLSTGLRENLLPDMKLVVMDTHDKAVEDLFQKEHFDAVVHLAAQTLVSDSMIDPENDMYQNVAGTVRILECCRKYGVKRVIFSSSAAIYGDVDEKALPISETLPQAPLSFYGLTKKTAEKYLELYHLAYGLDYVVLRFANVYGERQGDGGEGGVISIFTKRLAQGKGITIFGDGKQTRDFVYAGDIADGIITALTTDAKNTAYNLSTTEETSLNELVQILSRIGGKEITPTYDKPREGDIYRSSLNNAKAICNLDWKPKVSLEEGLRRVLEDFACRR
ncbi:MAG TPA: UDP-glucose 4-epimerase [Dialister sp.]|nr:UDP-glucose 4-epimerase [Dialister sp.]